MWRRPLLEVRNLKSGNNILPQLKGYWIEVVIDEKDGHESDTAQIVCVFRPGLQLPAKKDEYEIYMGWADEGLVLQGRFTVQKFSIQSEAETVPVLIIHLRAADYIDKLKADGSQDYSDPDFTFGDLMNDLASQAGVEATVDPDLAKVKIGYRLRFQQSPIDFAAEVAESIGGSVKPAAGKLIATKRGAGKSASGRNLDQIPIRYRRSMGFELEIEPRPQVGNVAAAWQDPASGRRKMVKESTGREGPIQILDHPYGSEEEAKEAAKAAAFEAGNATGTGYFDTYGRPKARAGAYCDVTEFPDVFNGVWQAKSVRKMISADDAFLTTINVSAGTEEKGKKKGKGKKSTGDEAGANDGLLPQ